MLKVENISKVYRMGDNEVYALRDVSLEIEAGDFVAIMGPSGSGKSTLMNVLGLLDTPDSGSYWLNGRDVSRLSESELALLRRKTIGFVFQQFHLLPRTTALDNVALPLFYSSPGGSREYASQLLDQVGLGHRKFHKTNELSGGQQQRVAIARALVNRPQIIFADEPTGNLDSASEQEILAILKKLNDQGITIVMVTHEEEIGSLAKRRIRMRDGKVHSDERLAPITAKKFPSAIENQATASSSILPVITGLIQQGLRTLGANWIRTSLSVLGVLIGVAAVITMLAIGSGARKEIERQLSSLGSNLLILRPGAGRMGAVRQESGMTRLRAEDSRILLENFPIIKNASATISERAQVQYGNKNWNTQVSGVEPSYVDLRSLAPTRGRFFSETENRSRAMVALIGTTIVKELFGDQNPIGEMIKINKLNFQVIGILPSKGMAGPRDQDDTIIIPVQTAMRRLFGKDYVESIEMEIISGADLSRAEVNIKQFMVTRHRVPVTRAEEAFQIRNMAELQEALSSSSRTMSSLLAAIAAISLLVGGIGIMNIMLVSVTERTREIGLRKAIGARPSDILLQFMTESVLMTLAGGLTGVLLGWIATLAVSGLLGWATSLDPTSVLLAFFFSGSIGMIFGIYPARRAASLNPIQALRHD